MDSEQLKNFLKLVPGEMFGLKGVILKIMLPFQKLEHFCVTKAVISTRILCKPTGQKKNIQ